MSSEVTLASAFSSYFLFCTLWEAISSDCNVCLSSKSLPVYFFDYISFFPPIVVGWHKTQCTNTGMFPQTLDWHFTDLFGKSLNVTDIQFYVAAQISFFFSFLFSLFLFVGADVQLWRRPCGASFQVMFFSVFYFIFFFQYKLHFSVAVRRRSEGDSGWSYGSYTSDDMRHGLGLWNVTYLWKKKKASSFILKDQEAGLNHLCLLGEAGV